MILTLQKFNMKKLITFVFLASLSISMSCQINTKPDVEDIEDNMVYFKDKNSGLCFGAVNSLNTKSASNSSSITCVPCDSLIKYKLLK